VYPLINKLIMNFVVIRLWYASTKGQSLLTHITIIPAGSPKELSMNEFSSTELASVKSGIIWALETKEDRKTNSGNILKAN